MLLPIALCSAAVCAQDGAGDAPILTREQLAERLNGVEASDITEAPIEGLYQVAVGSSVAYVSTDGRFIFRGDIYEVGTSENLTENTREQARVRMLGNVARDDMLVFSPKDGDVKHTITIFTDIDCGYCRQFHREIEKVNDLGIEVHYLFYPRTGPNTESWAKADEVWCAPDSNTALTRAKLGGAIPKGTCAGETPIEAHWNLGRAVGVTGTPAVFDEQGTLIGGYLPPDTLIKVLDGDVSMADLDAAYAE